MVIKIQFRNADSTSRGSMTVETQDEALIERLKACPSYSMMNATLKEYAGKYIECEKTPDFTVDIRHDIEQNLRKMRNAFGASRRSGY